jgi:hypothetical protein
MLTDNEFPFVSEGILQAYAYVTGFDLLGADVVMDGKKMDYFANLLLENNTITYERVTNDTNSKFVKCDMILNFFIAKTDKIIEYGWDNDLKLAEHTAFFFEHKGKLNVGYTQEISINHQKILEGDYVKFRTRAKNFLNEWMKKKNIDQIINLTGGITKRL